MAEEISMPVKVVQQMQADTNRDLDEIERLREDNAKLRSEIVKLLDARLVK